MTDKPTRRRNANCYDAQLEDDELLKIQEMLMGGRMKLEAILKHCPPWRTGPRAGKPPSLASIYNMRERLILKENLRESAYTTETLMKHLREDIPNITDEEITEYGNRAFSLMALRANDHKAWVALQKARKGVGELKLAREKFEIDVAKKLLDQALRDRAAEIARGEGTEAEKIAAMRKVYFSDVDALAESGAIKFPTAAA